MQSLSYLEIKRCATKKNSAGNIKAIFCPLTLWFLLSCWVAFGHNNKKWNLFYHPVQYIYSILIFLREMVFCYQNCSDLLWKKPFSSDRGKRLKPIEEQRIELVEFLLKIKNPSLQQQDTFCIPLNVWEIFPPTGLDLMY